MALNRFNHLQVPEYWEKYFTKYPQGMTILESLFQWVKQVDDMTDNVNNWNEYLEGFVKEFDKELQKSITVILKEWQESGFLDVIIDEALQTQMDVLETETEQKLEEFNNTINLMEKVGLNVARHGVTGVAGTDYTTQLQDLFDSVPNYPQFYFPKGTYGIRELSVTNKQGIVLKGATKSTTILRLLKDSGKKVAFNGVDDVTFEDMTIILEDDLTMDKLVFKDSSVFSGSKNIRFKNCHFSNLVNTITDNGTITFWKSTYNIEFDHCTFDEINNTVKLDNNYANIEEDTTRFNHCTFLGDKTIRAKKAIRYMGTGQRGKTQVFIQNSIFERFDSSVAELYHVQGYLISGNNIVDCKATKPSKTGDDTTETGLFWLDTESLNNRTNSQFVMNTFNNIIGVPIYVEEVLYGKIWGNRFINIKGRTDGVVTWTNGTESLVSRGNHCIIVGGGVTHLDISENTFDGVDRILLVCRKFSPKTIAGYYTEDIQFRNNSGVGVKETAIDLMERINRPLIKGNDIMAVGGSDYPFIEYTKITSQDLALIRVEGNTVHNFFKFYKRLSEYGNGLFINNYLYSSKEDANFFQAANRQSYVLKNNVFAYGMGASTFTMIEA